MKNPHEEAETDRVVRQFLVTPAAGKRLIAKAISSHPSVRKALADGTVVIVAGTTNGYIAEELVPSLSSGNGLAGRKFFRGITIPPGFTLPEAGESPEEARISGDIVLRKGVLEAGKTIFDVADELREGDVVLKGANALDVERGRAGILIGHPEAGTIGAIFKAVIGRRVKLILPVGLEKRISGDLDAIAALLNEPGVHGSRLFPVSGEVVSELDAVRLLSGATASMIAAGGIFGAEGSIWLAVHGTEEQVKKAGTILAGILKEPRFGG